jgi:2,3-bisphosphoglycerate-independent phosphoglycerate mutase
MSDTATTVADGPPRPVVLCILDGWGEREERDQNAIALAETPNWDRLAATWPRARLAASAGEVGLPPGQMGNSEVGHMNVGGGRVVMQDLPRIDAAIADESLADSPALAAFVERLRESGGVCHLMGLVSPGGVHSHQDHMVALARIVASAGVRVAVHAFLDGRDTPPSSAHRYVREFSAALGDIAGASIATVCGRYYAMDRDTRWDRVEKAYVALTEALGERAPDAEAAIEASYGAGVTDEFVAPTAIDGYVGMRDDDGVLMANFRADRAREILSALVDPAFDGFARRRKIAFAAKLGTVEYSQRLKAHMDSVFSPPVLENFLGQVVAEAGLRQLRIAETEKYAHVTFFFNGGREESYAGEERILVPSPGVATYDLQPEMSAGEVTDKLVAAIAQARFDLVIVNYANGDMVGHTGDLAAAIKAAEAVDACLGRLGAAATEAGGVLLITADHGNAETMRDPETGEPHTAHTLNLVPLVMVNAPPWVAGLRDGRLADVAPTVLKLMDLAQPSEMSGQPLIEEKEC